MAVIIGVMTVGCDAATCCNSHVMALCSSCLRWHRSRRWVPSALIVEACEVLNSKPVPKMTTWSVHLRLFHAQQGDLDPSTPQGPNFPRAPGAQTPASMKRVKRLDKAKWLLHRCQRLRASSLSPLLCLGRRTCGGVACGGHHCPKLATARDGRVRCRFARHELSQAITSHRRLLQLYKLSRRLHRRMRKDSRAPDAYE